MAAGIAAAALTGAFSAEAAKAAATADKGYVGSESCRECHGRFYELWSTSHHGTALQPFNLALARARLTPHAQALKVGAASYRADPGAAVVHEQTAAGTTRYEMTHAIGGKNVFYFLTPLERGRLQVLPLAYDVNRREWFDTAASAVRHFGGAADAPLAWRDPPYTFNTSCFNCHVSQLAANYDSQTDSYRTKWAEPGINCETCHGPCGEHVRAARLAPAGQPLADPKLIVARTLPTAQVNALCGSCHAKMTPLTTAFAPGERFFDHFNLATFEDPDFHADGRDLGENFTMTSWSVSPCAQSGQLSCMHCHTSSGRYRFRAGEPNAACLPCHEERVRKITAHSRHKADGEGGRCIACHMPMTEFARMRRTDHSMRPPTPAATVAFKSPNACTLCHTDQPPTWADKFVREWHADDYQAPVLQRATLIASARRADWSKLPEMVAYLASPQRHEVWSASLLRLLRGCSAEERWPAVRVGLGDRSPLVRAAAVEALGEQPPAEFLPALLAAARDEFRVVRVHAAAALAGVPPASLAGDDRRSLERATSEFIGWLRSRADDSASHHNLGNFHLSRGETTRAIEEFEAAIRLQPQNVASLTNRALAFAAVGRNDQAEASLRQALAVDPNHAAVHLNLGMLLAEVGKRTEAEQAFRNAYQSDPQSAAAAYNLGVMLAETRPDESLQWCRRAAELRPTEARYGYTLGYFLAAQRRLPEAADVLEKVIRLPAAGGEAYELLIGVYHGLNRPADVLRVQRAAGENPALRGGGGRDGARPSR